MQTVQPGAETNVPQFRTMGFELHLGSLEYRENVPTRAASRAPMVVPFARALALLGAFTPLDRCLGNRDLAERTQLPASTVSRIAQSLVSAGYLHHEPKGRKYRLGAAVLGLGYAATANSDVQRLARAQMQAFAAQHRVHVCLSTRDRLDITVLEACSSPGAPLESKLHVGARVSMASSPIGWGLLGSLPEVERQCLLNSLERRTLRDWPRLRRRVAEATAQVYESGYCSAVDDCNRNLGMVAVPLLIKGHEPRVLACVGASLQMGRMRVERELAPRLVSVVRALQEAGSKP